MYESIPYEVKCQLFNLPRWSLSVVGMDTVKNNFNAPRKVLPIKVVYVERNFTRLNSSYTQ